MTERSRYACIARGYAILLFWAVCWGATLGCFEIRIEAADGTTIQFRSLWQ